VFQAQELVQRLTALATLNMKPAANAAVIDTHRLACAELVRDLSAHVALLGGIPALFAADVTL
jgi:hypothetical protein